MYLEALAATSLCITFCLASGVIFPEQPRHAVHARTSRTLQMLALVDKWS